MKTILLLVALSSAFAQQAAMPAKPEKPAPVISTEQRARFWRTQTELLRVTAQLKTAQDASDAIWAEMRKACGDAPVIGDAKGEPSCDVVKSKSEPIK